eukprot:3167972-Pleurochrysis_carterae.AAC.4
MQSFSTRPWPCKLPSLPHLRLTKASCFIQGFRSNALLATETASVREETTVPRSRARAAPGGRPPRTCDNQRHVSSLCAQLLKNIQLVHNCCLIPNAIR